MTLPYATKVGLFEEMIENMNKCCFNFQCFNVLSAMFNRLSETWPGNDWVTAHSLTLAA